MKHRLVPNWPDEDDLELQILLLRPPKHWGSNEHPQAQLDTTVSQRVGRTGTWEAMKLNPCRVTEGNGRVQSHVGNYCHEYAC